MNFFKKIKKIFKAYKCAKLGELVFKYIKEKKYKKAVFKIKQFRESNSKTDKILDLILLENLLSFLLKDYKRVNSSCGFHEIIDNMRRHTIDQKKYQKMFVYNLIYLSNLFLDEIDKAIEIKKIFHEINYDLNMNNVKQYLKDRYPIYNAKLLDNLLIEDGYYAIYSKEKLDYILNNDIFHVDGIEIEDKDHLLLLK